MVVYNASTRELTAKIVYYGPGLGGKTTNLRVLHERLEPATVGKLLNLATQTDRTIYFDLLPVELGDIKGYKIRFQLATVPGQTAFNETRRVVLKGVDGIVFVADSQWTMLPKNLESWQNLKDNLRANGVSFEGIPIVVQFNKRDLPDILAVDAMQEALGLSSYPFVEAVASAGRGVTETFKLISKLTFVDLLRRLQGRRPEDAGAALETHSGDDLLSWRDSLKARPTLAGKARPLSLVPPTSDEAPFDTTELAQIDEEDTAGPFAQAAAPQPPNAQSPAETVRLEAVEPVKPSHEDTLDLAGGARPEPPARPFPPAEEPETPELPEAGLAELEERLSSRGQEGLRELEQRFVSRQAQRDRDIEERLSRQEERDRELEERFAAGELERERELPDRLAQIETRLREAQEESSRTLEERAARIEEALSSLASRLEAFERDARAIVRSVGELQEGFDRRLAALEEGEARRREAEERIRSLEERLASETARQRGVEDDVSAALRDLGERVAARDQQAAPLASRLDDLEALLHEKAREGRREAEDIRMQLSPLLEERVRRQESDQLIFAELDRLRDQLAESMQEISDRLRRVVRP